MLIRFDRFITKIHIYVWELLAQSAHSNMLFSIN